MLTDSPLQKDDLRVFNLLKHAVWIFDIERQSMWFANEEAVSLWDSPSLEDLINRDWESDMSDATQTRLDNYLLQFEDDKTVNDQWTFYPNGRAPITVNCLCSGVRIEDGRIALLNEARRLSTSDILPDDLRGIEALRHTSVNISQYDMDGQLLFRNPSAVKAFAKSTSFLSHFASAEDADHAWKSVIRDGYHTGKYRLLTTEGLVWHGIDCTLTVDPMTAKPAILVNKKDIHSEWWSESVLDWNIKVLDQIATNKPLQSLLETIVEMTEATEPDITCCVLLREPDDEHIRCAAAPTLPDSIIMAINDIDVSKDNVSFGTSAFSGQVSITEDIFADNDWKTNHNLIRRTGLRACWSVPIWNSERNTIGAFVAYYHSPKSPETKQLELLKMAGNLVELAIKRHTERQELISERERAEQASRAKSEFLSTMSHELRTPLTASIGSLGMLATISTDHLSEQGFELLEIAARNNKALLQLVNELLDFEKILSGILQIQTERHDACLLAEAIIRDLQGYAETQAVTFIFQKPATPFYISTHEHQFAQILRNLLSNAAKFSAPNTTVTITIESQEGWVTIRVKDQGPGIAEDFRSQIYDPFTQADSSATRKHGGTGLGLAISKALTEGMGGAIAFESEIGVGSTFQVRFPECPEDLKGDHPEASRA